MNKILRMGFSVIVVLVIALVAAAAVFVYTTDYNRHKGLIQKAVEDATGRQLAIKGDLTITMSLPPELAVSDVTLANAPWGSQPQMAHIGQLRLRIRLIPLLTRQLDIARIRLIDTDLLLETDASGQANWQFGDKKDSRASVGMWGVAVKQLKVEQLAVTLRSGAPSAHYKLDRLQLTRSAASDSLAGRISDLIPLKGIDLNLTGSGTDLAELGSFVGKKLPATGPFEVGGRLTGSAKALALSEAQGAIGQQSIKVALAGRIDDLLIIEGYRSERQGLRGESWRAA